MRLLVVQNCFGYFDQGLEDAVTELQSIRHFVGVDLSEERGPDSTTMVRFRNLLNERNLASAMAKDWMRLSQMRELGDLGVKQGCERFSVTLRSASFAEANGHNGFLPAN